MNALSDAASSGCKFAFKNPDQNVRLRHLFENLAPILRVKEIARVFIAQRQKAKHRDIMRWHRRDTSFRFA